MNQAWVMGNWKMNGTQASICALLSAIREDFPHDKARCVIFPPHIYLSWVKTFLEGLEIGLGAQNVYPKDDGAYTGEHSVAMLQDVGCQYVLVGHSERRLFFHEHEKFVAEKFHHAKERGMIPVLCVGETLAERKQGLTESVLARQIGAVFKEKQTDFQGCMVAYEPVWAIGTGQTATPEEAESAHAFIRHYIATHQAADATTLPILYGGSVNEVNAKSLFKMPNINGGLIGGASLNANSFLEILKCTCS